MIGKRPRYVILGTFLILVLSIFMIAIFPPKVLFFPDNQPNYLNVFVELPVGTNINKTNAKIYKHLLNNNLRSW